MACSGTGAIACSGTAAITCSATAAIAAASLDAGCLPAGPDGAATEATAVPVAAVEATALQGAAAEATAPPASAASTKSGGHVSCGLCGDQQSDDLVVAVWRSKWLAPRLGQQGEDWLLGSARQGGSVHDGCVYPNGLRPACRTMRLPKRTEASSQDDASTQAEASLQD